jgi:hypothetical protein
MNLKYSMVPVAFVAALGLVTAGGAIAQEGVRAHAYFALDDISFTRNDTGAAVGDSGTISDSSADLNGVGTSAISDPLNALQSCVSGDLPVVGGAGCPAENSLFVDIVGPWPGTVEISRGDAFITPVSGANLALDTRNVASVQLSRNPPATDLNDVGAADSRVADTRVDFTVDAATSFTLAVTPDLCVEAVVTAGPFNPASTLARAETNATFRIFTTDSATGVTTTVFSSTQADALFDRIVSANDPGETGKIDPRFPAQPTCDVPSQDGDDDRLAPNPAGRVSINTNPGGLAPAACLAPNCFIAQPGVEYTLEIAAQTLAEARYEVLVRDFVHKCYFGKQNPPFPAGNPRLPVPIARKFLSDQFVSNRDSNVNFLQGLCNPADKNDQDNLPPLRTDHLSCYGVTDASLQAPVRLPRAVQIRTGNFGLDTVTLSPIVELCVPAGKSRNLNVPAPAPTPGPAYKCYNATFPVGELG